MSGTVSLSSTDLADTRRFCGYPVQAALPFFPTEVQGWSVQLDTILAALTSDQITILQTQYLAPLRLLEPAIISAGANLDTDQAAVWKHNKNEVQDRDNLYMITRRKLAFFLGIPAGDGITPLAPGVLTT
jgi:hypothetical protein